ncbi:hypothetical protein [Corallococcus carmarthensis]|uniref:Uncharacterized protein n=1 Tax=Corallococcus carmarthensis TaxID=2316728 RepID=A0A3A8JJU3_9BACT|nr:hypothetical protein [Corallococcus carmarthensis]NOK22018.1 hypothetical protein [Corallococcus carmarthensis]RKG95226.1 hypothetical protein D7X32_39665 [Corallococcus carmarthensis]
MATRILTSLAVASVFLSASPVSASYREAAYVTTLYSDASHTTVVGHIYPECGLNYIQYHLVGTYTYFATDEFVGYCTENGWEPL